MAVLASGTAVAAAPAETGYFNYTIPQRQPDGTTRQVSIDQAQPVNPVPTTLAERLEWERTPKSEDAVPARIPTNSGQRVTYDPVTVEECKAFTASDQTPYAHKNHYGFCSNGSVEIGRMTCPFPSCLHSKSFGLTIIGHGDRNIETGAVQRKASFTLNTRMGHTIGTQVPDNILVTVGLDCVALNGTTCNNPWGGGITKTLGEWRRDETETATLTIEGTPSEIPTDPNWDGKSYYNLRPFIRHNNPQFPPTERNLPWDAMRCDTSTKNYSRPYRDNGACIFTNINALFPISRAPGSPHKSVGDHLWQALNKPLETKPGVPNKVIPGKPGSGQPLTRLVDHTPELDARITKNRTRARENCVRFWGVDYAKPESPNSEYPKQKRDCDEYPMASTFEGAAHADYQPGSILSFSSKPVPFGENRSAGNWLQQWYAEDHIIHGDYFYIRVLD
ncbi:NucA/NucB deoxyribonuclease domain-containing protein [Pilimelia terevasa]|uniref:NucA/NucB deoxyribonuclease domain-containing protein n=1 Tax=Pilimelia terevasa TaxID=53372 RepID=UPI00166520B9|nr:NucA/NucB deoxyribonuclease domain-containing protein [Pilimelia terevasa]